MSSHEDFYRAADSPRPPSQVFQAEHPPPPPPKPDRNSQIYEGTPQPLSGPAAGQQGPPLPPTPLQQRQYVESPQPQPPVPAQYQSPQYSPAPRTPLNVQGHIQSIVQPHFQPPPFEAHWLPQATDLTSKQTSDLALILRDPKLTSALATSHPSHASSQEPLKTALDANIELANRVSALEKQVASLRTQTQQLLLQHTTLSTQWRRKQSEMDSALAPWGPRAMYQRLVAGIGEQEAILRAVEESFLESAGDDMYGEGGARATEKEVNDWIRRIRDGTVVLEKRREARARWDEGRVGGWR